MSAGRYDDRIVDLLRDAHAAAEAEDWPAVRALAGAALALEPGHPEAQRLLESADGRAPQAGERRQLTVMFCDVVGSTTLTEQQDPELVGEVLRSYQVTCDRVVRRYEGRIARYIGDGVLAYFGHPVPHEDDARRGVKAGLDLLEALRPVSDEVSTRYGIDLRVRVAVHTGVVVRADMGSAATPDRDAIVGDTPNIAARLQDHAAPGTLVISHDTYELVRGWFLVAPLGEQALKGIAKPLRAYQVVDEAPDDGRVHAQADLSPFVGRATELEALQDAWTDASGGGSATVALVGQAGVGKSRLADLLRRRVEATDGAALVTGCSTFHRTTALYPARRLLERAAGIDAHEQADRALPRLWTAMEGLGLADRLPLVANLLELPPEPWCPAPELDGTALREQLLDALQTWVAASATRTPLLLLVEDLQWADPTTVELLGRIVRAGIPRLLLVVTAREEVKVPWASATVVLVERLAPEELSELARRLPEGRQLSAADLERAIGRSDGIPLFLEELVRSAGVATGDGRAAGAIPPALRDLLLARFAAPGVDLRTAQRLATIGTEASLPLIDAATRDLGIDLDEQLGALVDAGIVKLVPGDPPTYRFHHHLLAELAYDTQLTAARHAAHLAVAEGLRSGLAVGSTGGPAVLAHHLEQAGRPDEAVAALLEAVDLARGLGANAEVDELLGRAAALLDAVPADRRTVLELDLRLLRGAHAASILGYAAPQAAEDFAACGALVEEIRAGGLLGEDDEAVRDELVWSGSGLWAAFLLQGRIAEARAVNRSLTSHCQPGSTLHDYFRSVDGVMTMFEGDFVSSEADLRRNVELFPRITVSRRMSVPSDPGVAARAHLGFTLGMRCRVDEAQGQLDLAFREAQALPFPHGPFSACYVNGLRTGVALMVRDVPTARARATELAEAAERHGYTFWTLVGGYWLAALDLHDGVEGAEVRSRMSLELLRAVGVLVWLPSFLATLSEVHLRRGELDAAATLLADASAVEASTGARFWAGEILRQQALVDLARDEPAAGEARLREAVAVAEAQGATLLELRARTELARATGQGGEREALAALVAGLGDRLERLPVERSAAEAALQPAG